MTALVTRARTDFHRQLVDDLTLMVDDKTHQLNHITTGQPGAARTDAGGGTNSGLESTWEAIGLFGRGEADQERLGLEVEEKRNLGSTIPRLLVRHRSKIGAVLGPKSVVALI